MIPYSSRALQQCAQQFNIQLVILFGSAAKEQKSPEDIDVALMLPFESQKVYERDIDAYTNLWRSLANALNVSEDVLDITLISPKTPPLLLYYIARDGRLLYGNEQAFAQLRLFAVKRFFDTAPLRRARIQYIKDKLHA